MEREKLLKQFKYAYVLIEGTSQMKKLYRYCRDNMENLCKSLEHAFEYFTEQFDEEQKEKKDKNLSCIHFSILRTRYLYRDGTVWIHGWDERLYLDSEEVRTKWDASILFQYLWDLENSLSHSLKDFKGIITMSDLKEMMMEEYVPYLIQCLTEVIRYAVRKNYFQGLSKLPLNPDFYMMVGEYRGRFDEVSIEKRSSDLLKLLESDPENHTELFCRYYTDIKSEHLILERMNFTKSDFLHVDLIGASFCEAYLIKTRFMDCCLKNSSFRRSLLFDADFSGSDLSGADFTGSMASVTEPDLFFPCFFSLIGADFTNANLSDVNFTRANLNGADFRDAIFKHTLFTGAQLYQTRFKKESLSQLGLTQEQMNMIDIYD